MLPGQDRSPARPPRAQEKALQFREPRWPSGSTRRSPLSRRGWACRAWLGRPLRAASLAASGGTLRIAAFDVGSVDPTLDQDFSLEFATFLRLVSYPDREGPGSNRVIPEAAEALPTISRDRRTYVFTIRKGLRFSDGTPVTAANFAFGLARAFRPEFGSPAAFMSDIVGAKSVIEGRAVTLAGVRARGRTLTISLTRPQPALLAGLANEGQALPLGLPPTVPVTVPVPSAGPYYVKEWDPEKRVLLVRNPYWNRRAIPWRPARLDAIEWTLGLDSEEGVRMVEQGALDLISAYRASTREHPRARCTVRDQQGTLLPQAGLNPLVRRLQQRAATLPGKRPAPARGELRARPPGARSPVQPFRQRERIRSCPPVVPGFRERRPLSAQGRGRGQGA